MAAHHILYDAVIADPIRGVIVRKCAASSHPVFAVRGGTEVKERVYVDGYRTPGTSLLLLQLRCTGAPASVL